jgi:hypothetical protein
MKVIDEQPRQRPTPRWVHQDKRYVTQKEGKPCKENEQEELAMSNPLRATVSKLMGRFC